MRINSITVTNFGSYENLSFKFTDLGLALISGKTGSGKSTIMDAVSWVLYGETAKGVGSDDVRSWTTNEVTLGAAYFDDITIYRSRGKGQNDLYWLEGTGEPHRGKDITETQKLLNLRIGADINIFNSASYYNEFSPTSNFFLAKAKDRRELFEQLASLELPKKLAVRSSEERKVIKSSLTRLENQYSNLSGKNNQMIREHNNAIDANNSWGEKQKALIQSLQFKSNSFQVDKEAKIAKLLVSVDELTSKIKPVTLNDTNLFCDKCKQSVQNIAGIRAVKNNEKLNNEIYQLELEISFVTKTVDIFKELAKAEEERENPHGKQIERLSDELTGIDADIIQLSSTIKELEAKFSALDHLYALSSELRAQLLKSSVKSIEEATNQTLEDYFDSEIRVTFEIDSSDNLDVTIHKSGNECSFKQLSKGQRQLLKLAFVVSAMSAVADKCGIHFENLFFDESLDGLDPSLKIKAYQLFESLSQGRSSVLVIDHSEELQQMFAKRFTVKMDNEVSTIYES